MAERCGPELSIVYVCANECVGWMSTAASVKEGENSDHDTVRSR